MYRIIYISSEPGSGDEKFPVLDPNSFTSTEDAENYLKRSIFKRIKDRNKYESGSDDLIFETKKIDGVKNKQGELVLPIKYVLDVLWPNPYTRTNELAERSLFIIIDTEDKFIYKSKKK